MDLDVDSTFSGNSIRVGNMDSNIDQQLAPKMRAACFVFLLATLALAGDPFTFLHPELVINRTCTVKPTTYSENGSKVARDVYSANAVAEREGMENWSTTWYFDYNDKGMGQATDACKDWMRKTSKLIKKARGIK